MNGDKLRLILDKNIAKWGECKRSYHINNKLRSRVPVTGVICTNSKFSENILYPKDYITFFSHTKKSVQFKKANYLIAQLDVRIKESAPERKFYLYRINENKTNVLMEVNESKLENLIHKYFELMEN